MPLTLTQMRKKVRNATGMDENDLGNTDVDTYLQQSIEELVDKFQFREKEVTATFHTIIGQRDYDLPIGFDALRHISIRDNYGNGHSILKRMTARRYEDVYDEDAASYDKPVEYLREGCKIRLWPTPNADYLMTLKYWVILQVFSIDPDTGEPRENTTLPRAWDELVLYGAIWRVLLEYGDATRSTFFLNVQSKLINEIVPVESKEETDSPYAGLELINSQRLY